MSDNFDEYRKAMDGLRFSPEAKERLARFVAAASEAKSSAAESARPEVPVRTTRCGARRWRWAAAVAAAAALALAVGGGAYASGALMGVANVFDDVFGGAPAQTEIVDKIGRPIGASASSGGVSVTAEAIVGDRANYVIVYSVAKDDGTPFDLPEPLDDGVLPLFFEGSAALRVDGERGGGGSAYFYDADPADNAIQYVQQMSVDMDGGSLVGKTARASFENLSVQGDGAARTLAEGVWNLKFAIGYEDTSVSLSAGQPLDLDGMAATVDAVAVSPIAVTVNYTVDAPFAGLEQGSGKTSEEAASELGRFNPDVALNLKDGTVLDASNGAWGSRQAGSRTICYKSTIFPRFLNLEDVESVTVGTATVPMP